MKERLLIVFWAVVALLGFSFAQPALAQSAAAGAAVFSANCAACHIGGGNVVNAAKTLKIDDLKANGKDTIEAIQTQITNGNGAMPSFQGRLTPEQIADVAAYVLSPAENGW
jgi:cytochrome c6